MDDRSPEERLADEESRAFKELDRSNKCKAILEDEFFVAAVEAIKQQLYEEFARSPLEDDTQRLRARLGIDMLDKILSQLRHHIQTGKMAQVALTEIEQKRRWFNRKGAA